MPTISFSDVFRARGELQIVFPEHDMLICAAEVIDKLTAALEPFAQFADVVGGLAKRTVADDETVATCGRFGTETYRAVTYGHFRNARAALSLVRQEEKG